MKQTLTLTWALLSFPLYAANSTVINDLNWTLRKSAQDVQVYSAKVPESKYKAILSVTTVNSPSHRVINVIRDTYICQQWIYRCKQSQIYRRINTEEEYIYTSISMPFPFKNRDILAHVKWATDPDTQITVSAGIATQNIMELQKGHTRIKNAEMIWEITPLKNGQTTIRNYGHIDPAGGIPIWLSNRFSIKAPFKTMLGLREILKSPPNEN